MTEIDENIFEERNSGDLSGVKVSDLPSIDKMMDYDLFLVEKNQSYKIKYKDFRSYVMRRVFDILNLGTASRHDEEYFAKIGHAHDQIFSKVSFIQNPNIPEDKSRGIFDLSVNYDIEPRREIIKVEDEDEDGNPIETEKEILVDNETIVYNVKGYDSGDIGIVNPFVGQIKFMTWNSFEDMYQDLSNSITGSNDQFNIDPLLDDFDGWVLANGVSVDVGHENSKFLVAFDKFGKNGSKIAIPSLSNFMYIDNFGKSMVKIDPNIGIGRHRHHMGECTFGGKLEKSKNFTLKNILKLREYAGNSNFHAGYPISNKVDKTASYIDKNGVKKSFQYKGLCTTTFSKSLKNIKISGFQALSQNIDEEPKPKHQIIIPMIYIGR